MTRAKRERVVESPRPLWWRLAAWYLRRPRLLRIVVAALFGLGTTLLVSPQVDYTYLRYFFSADTRVLPSLLSTAVGVIVYVIGWRLTLSVEAAEKPSLRATAWYLLSGLLVLLALVVLLVVGLITINLPT